ncbi:hypothetical protein JTE90_008994 [Oedothorax gibbosus]|uniref:Uncharacterized protein n=1 Tax=Oedothorax gibbosus TaxID=931172 RepID=A0AAV6UL89_9ARAC|nr:hypothetical protein JTE90_008994 [Oedothorax gibbosus]
MGFWKAFVLWFVFAILGCEAQQYDFAAEISRQCLVPDPVGLLDCVENKVTLPYLVSWVECTNSLGQNVKTSADIINYRCKSVWEGKGVIPEVFYIKDCVIEKTGLPAKNVSAEVLGAYKECEASPNAPSQRIQQNTLSQTNVKTIPIQGSPVQQQRFSQVPQQAFAPVQANAPAQEYDFGAEISRQCLVPDPVGLLDCVENKVTLPYLTSWVDCTNSLGQNVRTSADIINYRCKSVWEGKGVIPEVFYIKDCVIAKTGLPSKNVSAEVLGAYKECEATPATKNAIKTTANQQQPNNGPTQEYDFAAEISRQCLVPDPVGLLDCVENKVNLPYMSSWVECTNSLGQNVKTSADIINYRCKSVWEGKGVIPEVFYIKDCVIAKTGLPAQLVSAEVLGAYKECEATPSLMRQTQPVPRTQTAIKTTQQQANSSPQEYDFAAEISRQCMVPDPVGLLDCVENKVTLPYLSSWVECTNSLGQNVKTSADIINYRCKSVWEGKGVIPEVFYIKDCVIAKTGLPAQRVSTEVLGAYKECEAAPTDKHKATDITEKQCNLFNSSNIIRFAQSNAGGYGQRLNPTNLSPLQFGNKAFPAVLRLISKTTISPQQQFSTTTQQQIPVNFNQATGRKILTATQEQQITGRDYLR